MYTYQYSIWQHHLIGILSLVISAFCINYNVIDPITPQQRLGKEIYENGDDGSEQNIFANMGEIAVPASILPCINCHGQRGEGNPEGGIDPSNIQWNFLTKPYNYSNTYGRTRAPYTMESLRIAITKGIDPSGNNLNTVMPRYSMEDVQLDNLIEYLKILPNENHPGISDTVIQIGVILNPLYEKRVEEVLTAYFNWINSKQGIYNRKIVPYYFYVSGSEETDFTRFNSFIEEHQIFAFVSSFLTFQTRNILDKIVHLEIPIIGAIGGRPSLDEFSVPIYYLYPDINIQAYDLVLSCLKKAEKNPIEIWYNSNSESHEIKKYLDEKLIHFPNSRITFIDFNKYKESINVPGNPANIISLLSIKELLEISDSKQITERILDLYIPGGLSNSNVYNLPIGLSGRIFLTYPNWISERKEYAMKSYYNLLRNNNLKSEYVGSQINALSAALLFTEVLKSIGREVSRQDLINEIENLRQFKTGYMPDMSFEPNKKFGSNHVFLLEVNLEKSILTLKEKRTLLK